MWLRSVRATKAISRDRDSSPGERVDGWTPLPVPVEQVVIERPNADQPHRGKVLALIAPHLDDGPIFAGGTLAKLLSEGYTGYFIRTSNDEKDSYHLSLGETVLANERDTAYAGQDFGVEEVVQPCLS